MTASDVVVSFAKFRPSPSMSPPAEESTSPRPTWLLRVLTGVPRLIERNSALRGSRIVPSVLRAIALFGLLFTAGCIDLGDPPKTTVTGRLNVGPGVVFIERGPIYQGTFERAGVVGPDGRFSIELASSGPHGFHAYVNDYIYLPIGIEVEPGVPNRITQDRVDWDFLCSSAGMCDWVGQPTAPDVLAPAVDDDLGNNPVATGLRVVRVAAGRVWVYVDVQDPNGDLSNQILLHNMATGDGYALNPPTPVIDGNYPNGTYVQPINVSNDAPTGGQWEFVAADHTCSNSQILHVTETAE